MPDENLGAKDMEVENFEDVYLENEYLKELLENYSDKHFVITSDVQKFKCAVCGKCCRIWAIRASKKELNNIDVLKREDPYILKKFNFAKVDDDFVLSYDCTTHILSILRILIKNFKNSIHYIIKYRQYAVIVLLSALLEFKTNFFLRHTFCGVLNEKTRKCYIHESYGPGFQIPVCRVYPRNVMLTPRGVEISLSYSCKDTAKLLKDKTELVILSDPKDFGFKLPDGTPVLKLKDNYFRKEDFIIKLFKMQNISIKYKIILLGMMSNELQVQGTFDESVAGKFMERAMQNVELMSQVSPGISLMFEFVKKFFDMLPKYPIAYSFDFNVLRCVAFKNFIGTGDEMQRINDFKRAYRDLYMPFCGNQESVYEKYLINMIFSKSYIKNLKFNSYNDLFLLLSFYFVVLSFLNVCKCFVLKTQMNEDFLIDIIVEFERIVTHCNPYRIEFMEYIREKYSNSEIFSMVGLFEVL